MISFEAMRKPLKRREVQEFLLGLLQGLGFQTTGWQPGRIQHSIVYAVSAVQSDMSEFQRFLAENIWSATAKGPMLTILSRDRYENIRKRAVKTAGPMLLKSTSLVPYTLTPGQLIVNDPYGVVFRNTTGGTIAAGGTLTLQFEAELAGSDGNVASGVTMFQQTPVAGVRITNPSPSGSPVGTPWYTTTGVDEESDENLRRRNATKWATLSLERIYDWYIHIALGLDGVEKVEVHDQHPRGPGTVDVYISAKASTLGSTQLAAAQAKFADCCFRTDATWPRPTTDTSEVAVKSPSTLTLAPKGIVYYSGNLQDFKTRLKQKLDDFVKRIPLGGFDTSPGPQNILMLSEIMSVFESLRACQGVTLTTPTGNITVPPFTLVVPPVDWFDESTGLVLTAVTSG